MGLLQEKLGKYDLPQQIKAKGVYPYFRCIESEQNTEVTMSGRKVLMFGSNSYLGLTNHPKVIEAAVEATRKYGTGCAGSRFLNGTLDIHLELEKELAEFIGKEDAIIYSTGFQVNLGVVSCVTGREDYVICDELDHASIVEGRRLSFSTALKFKHNDMESLEKELKRCRPESVKLIVVDGVFSMEGDIANLPEIVRLAKKYNANIMVDEAHGLGVLGRQGRGTCDHFGVTKDVDLIMGTFSKSLAAIGGFIASDEATINYLRHNSRSYIFSASNTPAATAAARLCVEELPRTWFRNRCYFYSDHPIVCTRYGEDILGNKDALRRRCIRKPGCSSSLLTKRYVDPFLFDGYTHAGTSRLRYRETRKMFQGSRFAEEISRTLFYHSIKQKRMCPDGHILFLYLIAKRSFVLIVS